jgi:hypothetical protein
MKVLLDLDRLLNEGKITQAEFDKFSQFAARSTSSLAFNILIGFGVIAVAGGTLALLPRPVTAIVLGTFVSAVGITLIQTRVKQWMVLANICVLVGALLFGGGVIKAGEGSIASFLLVAAAFAGASVFARSGLLAVLSVVALSSCVGARTAYFHAAYFLGIQEPSVTVILFTIFSIGLYQLSKRIGAEYQRLAVIAARTGVFLVNFGFWIGSLWGDRLEKAQIIIADWVFGLLWAVALLATGVWAWRTNKRWVLNLVATFAAIHFYTQWFERLGARPGTVLIAGLLALGFAIAVRTINVKLTKGTEGDA